MDFANKRPFGAFLAESLGEGQGQNLGEKGPPLPVLLLWSGQGWAIPMDFGFCFGFLEAGAGGGGRIPDLGGRYPPPCRQSDLG